MRLTPSVDFGGISISLPERKVEEYPEDPSIGAVSYGFGGTIDIFPFQFESHNYSNELHRLGIRIHAGRYYSNLANKNSVLDGYQDYLGFSIIYDGGSMKVDMNWRDSNWAWSASNLSYFTICQIQTKSPPSHSPSLSKVGHTLLPAGYLSDFGRPLLKSITIALFPLITTRSIRLTSPSFGSTTTSVFTSPSPLNHPLAVSFFQRLLISVS